MLIVTVLALTSAALLFMFEQSCFQRSMMNNGEMTETEISLADAVKVTAVT